MSVGSTPSAITQGVAPVTTPATTAPLSAGTRLAGAADQALGPTVGSGTVSLSTTPSAQRPGSDSLYDQMKNAKDPAIDNLSQPPSDANMQAWYKTHAKHSDLIAQGNYSGAAAAYRKEADDPNSTLPQDEANRMRKTAEQLDYAAKMETEAQAEHKEVSFPPTLDQVKNHFSHLKNQPGSTVADEFHGYTKAFYEHVQNDPESVNKGIKDIDYNSHDIGLQKKSTAPTSDAEVTGDRELNDHGQRVIDCEGYAYLGKQLLEQADYKTPPGGAFHRVYGEGHEADTGHVMLQMKRKGTGEDAWISDSNMYTGPSAEPNAFKGLKRVLGGNPVDYQGATEDAAIYAEAKRETAHLHTPRLQ